jgi:preprotein translocase subunit SecG
MKETINEENEYIRFKIFGIEFVVKKITKGTILVTIIFFIFILCLALILKLM